MSHGSAYDIIHNELSYQKVCARWVPRFLTPEMKQNCVVACQTLLDQYECDGEAFLDRTVTTDESWVHHYTPANKQSSMEWRHTESPRPRKVCVQSPTGKVMLTVFWGKKGVTVEHYLPKGQTVNSRSYCDLLQNHLSPAIRSKCRGLLSKGVCLQQDNARPHTTNATMMTLRHVKLEVLPHPPYFPDLAPSDFHLFGPLKEFLQRRKFSMDYDVQSAVHEWLRGQPQ